MFLLPLLATGLLLAGAADDAVPAALDALLAQPDDDGTSGLPVAAPGEALFLRHGPRTGRALADVGDVNGDGAADVAVAFGPGVAPHLQVLDGKTGVVQWSAPGGQGYRSLRALRVAGEALIAAGESRDGRVVAHARTDGSVLWSRALVPAGTAPEAMVSLYAVDPLPLPPAPGAPGGESGDGSSADVLVAGGRGFDGVVRLDGRDGTPVWTRHFGQPVYDVRASGGDRDGDGIADLFVSGGDDLPFAALLSGADGEILWQALLSGPGAVVQPLGDVDDDGMPDVAVGLFAEPDPCLVGLSGQDGASLWIADIHTRNTTALAVGPDVDVDGHADLIVGSYDNAVSVYAARTGFNMWRREVSMVNGGHILSVAALADQDGNGSLDVVGGSQDNRVYTFGGIVGQMMSVTDVRDGLVAVTALDDGDGDGRLEVAVTGEGLVGVLDGASGLASGPKVFLDAVEAGEARLQVYAYPGSGIWMFVSRGTGDLPVPGFAGSFGLDLVGLELVFKGTAPGAGISGFVVGPYAQTGTYTLLHAQAVTVFPDGRSGIFSNVLSFPISR